MFNFSLCSVQRKALGMLYLADKSPTCSLELSLSHHTFYGSSYLYPTNANAPIQYYNALMLFDEPSNLYL